MVLVNFCRFLNPSCFTFIQYDTYWVIGLIDWLQRYAFK